MYFGGTLSSNISAEEIEAYLHAKGGSSRTNTNGVIVVTGRGKFKINELRAMLYEMAARQRIHIEFDPRDHDRIVSICLPGQSDQAKELAQLRSAHAALHEELAAIRTKMQHDRADVEAAEQLVAEAQTASLALADQLRIAKQQLVAANAGHPRAKDRRRIGYLEARVEAQHSEIKQLRLLANSVPGYEAEVAELNRQLKELGVQLASIVEGVGGQGISAACGCFVLPTGTVNCRIGKTHDLYVLTPSQMAQARQGKAFILPQTITAAQIVEQLRMSKVY